MAIEQIAYPFRLDGQGNVATVEQDTFDEVAQSVQVLLTTNQGDRIEVPAYGVPDLVFSTGAPAREQEILSRIKEWEPRASALLAIDIDRLDELIHHIQVRLRDVFGTSFAQSSAQVDNGQADGDGGAGFGIGAWGIMGWGS